MPKWSWHMYDKYCISSLIHPCKLWQPMTSAPGCLGWLTELEVCSWRSLFTLRMFEFDWWSNLEDSSIAWGWNETWWVLLRRKLGQWRGWQSYCFFSPLTVKGKYLPTKMAFVISWKTIEHMIFICKSNMCCNSMLFVLKILLSKLVYNWGEFGAICHSTYGLIITRIPLHSS